ncbi:hypothetical protein LshimejAT787_1401540 [Lyophyllum shimeji]|uniref:F-box domain-containing protein n=1 Tax=Lyophyllum shimeji TaxID=47721 RepID=A0A9P3PVE4_LYOSH|nr:hypothetical protein LshimejAT787_1401540 [Lyophyllum shimeji]
MAPATDSPPSLSTLPAELLHDIIQLTETPDLVSLCQTTRSLQAAATWSLYRKIRLSDASKAVRCFQTIIARPEAALAVRHMELRFPRTDFLSSFFKLAAAAIRCTTLVDHLDLSRAGPVLKYLDEVPLKHLKRCVMPYSPDMFFFLDRHKHITWLAMEPDRFSVRAARQGVRVPQIHLSELSSLVTLSSMVQLLGPLPALKEADIYWEIEGNAGTIVPLLAASTTLRRLSCMTSVTNLGLIAALATHLPHVAELRFRLDSPYPAYKDEINAFLDTLERYLPSFHSLTHIQVKLPVEELRAESAFSFEEVEEEFETAIRWGKLCPKLETCRLITGVCWGRTVTGDYWLPPARSNKAERMAWALAVRKYSSMDADDLFALQICPPAATTRPN